MRQSNVDISKLPKFKNRQEAYDYFSKHGTLEYFGREGVELYCVYSFVRKDGRRYSIDITDDGEVAVIKWKSRWEM